MIPPLRAVLCSFIIFRIVQSLWFMNRLSKSFVICGPSGVGKGTIISRLLKNHPDKISLCVSHTSRPPRKGEIDGFHYHFVSRAQLLEDIEKGPIKFIEHARVHDNLYGTRQDSVDRIHKQGMIALLDLDMEGVKSIQACGFDAKLMFIAPPSLKSLERQLRGRGTESEESIQTRLANARKELEYGTAAGNFDAVVVNDSLDECFRSVESRLHAWFPQLGKA